MNGIIKKHELTRPDKEEDRMILTRYVKANLEPVFFAYKAVPEIDAIVEDIVKNQKADYDFVAEDGFGHHSVSYTHLGSRGKHRDHDRRWRNSGIY